MISFAVEFTSGSTDSAPAGQVQISAVAPARTLKLNRRFVRPKIILHLATVLKLKLIRSFFPATHPFRSQAPVRPTGQQTKMAFHLLGRKEAAVVTVDRAHS